MARATIHLDPRAPRRKTGPPHRPQASDCRSLAHRSVLCSFFLHSVLSIVMPRRRRRSRASGVILTCGPSRTLVVVSRGSRSTWRSEKRPRSITSVWSAGPCAVAARGAEAVRATASRTPRDRAPPVRPEGVPPAVFPAPRCFRRLRCCRHLRRFPPGEIRGCLSRELRVLHGHWPWPAPALRTPRDRRRLRCARAPHALPPEGAPAPRRAPRG